MTAASGGTEEHSPVRRLPAAAGRIHMARVAQAAGDTPEERRTAVARHIVEGEERHTVVEGAHRTAAAVRNPAEALAEALAIVDSTGWEEVAVRNLAEEAPAVVDSTGWEEVRRHTVVVVVEEPVAVDNTDWEEARCRRAAVAAGAGSIRPPLFVLASSALLFSPGRYLLTAVTRVRHGARRLGGKCSLGFVELFSGVVFEKDRGARRAPNWCL